MTVTYDEDFYNAQKEESLLSARVAVPLVLEVIGRKINSVVDIGCGVGTWLSVYKEQGVGEVFGVDGDYVDRDMLLIDQMEFKSHDLTKKLELDRNFDLALSLEVAEHIDDKLAPLFCENLTNLAAVIFFSAAIPGQGGTHHINEQWPNYWRKLFAEKGYVMVDVLRSRLWGLEKLKAHYAQNSFIYIKESELVNYPQLKVRHEQGDLFPLDVVHPKLFDFHVRMNRQEREITVFLKVLKLLLPSFVSNAIRRYRKG